jgi:hypothetical protein
MSTESVKLVGTVKQIKEESQITDNFSKRSLWMDIDEDTEYPQEIEVEFVNDKCGLLNKYSPEDHVEVDANIRGRESKDGQYRFTKLQAWRIKGTAMGGNTTQAAQPAPAAAPPADQNPPDDLPDWNNGEFYK